MVSKIRKGLFRASNWEGQTARNIMFFNYFSKKNFFSKSWQLPCIILFQPNVSNKSSKSYWKLNEFLFEAIFYFNDIENLFKQFLTNIVYTAKSNLRKFRNIGLILENFDIKFKGKNKITIIFFHNHFSEWNFMSIFSNIRVVRFFWNFWNYFLQCRGKYSLLKQ